MNPNLNQAVRDAVDLVNSNAGHTSVHLMFHDDSSALDFIANSARLQGPMFEFNAGFETYGGRIDELSDIRFEIINR